MDFNTSYAATIAGRDCTAGDSAMFKDITIKAHQVLRKRPISTGNAIEQRIESLAEDLIRPMFENLFPKRRRLNPRRRSVVGTNLMDLNDDALGVIALGLVRLELPIIARPRQMQNLLQAYSFANANHRTRRIFHDYVCQKIHTLDAVFPLKIIEEVRHIPPFARPDNIAFLCKVAGSSLRVVRIPCFKAIGAPIDAYQISQLNRVRYMMCVLAQNCSKLIELAFQDAGSTDNGISKLLFTRNPGLKRIQVDIPGPEFLSALASSECDIDELTLIRVQTSCFAGLRKLLSGRVSSLRKLTISTCLPLDPDFQATPANKARCRRREKTFIERLETLTRTKMTSLRSLHLLPDRRAAWFKRFIQRYQMLGRADLITGDSKTFYPAATNPSDTEPPLSKFHLLSMDQILTCHTEEMFTTYMSRLHEPDTLSIMRHIFTHTFSMRHNDVLEENVKTAICAKGQGLKRFVFATPIPRIYMFRMFLDTAKEILNIIDEEFKNLDQIEEVRIPVHVVTYLANGVGYNGFFGRLTNLKVLLLIKPQIQPDVTTQVVTGIPAFLRGIKNVCPELESIYISNGDRTKMRPNENIPSLGSAIEDAVIAIREYEEANPKVDVSTLQRQVSCWASDLIHSLPEKALPMC